MKRALVLLALCATAYAQVSNTVVHPPHEDAAKDAAAKALSLLNEHQQNLGGEAKGPLQLETIKGVRAQVVSGMRYTIDLILKDSAGAPHEVEVSMWARPWLAAKNDPNDPPFQLTSIKLIQRTPEQQQQAAQQQAAAVQQHQHAAISSRRLLEFM